MSKSYFNAQICKCANRQMKKMMFGLRIQQASNRHHRTIKNLSYPIRKSDNFQIGKLVFVEDIGVEPMTLSLQS